MLLVSERHLALLLEALAHKCAIEGHARPELMSLHAILDTRSASTP
jgi:hypothetical protein